MQLIVRMKRDLKAVTFAQILGILNNTFKPAWVQQSSRMKKLNL
jgi:hypothetical protein